MKIGVIGHGSIGSRHAKNAKALGHEVRFYDPAFSMKSFKFERQLYDWADAVVVASPSAAHIGPLQACVERGKHVLVEKPLATSPGPRIEALLTEADAKSLVVMMGTNLRFHPCVQQTKNWLDSGHIGLARWAQFTCATETEKKTYLSDGVTLCTGAHEVDLALHFFGPARVLMACAHWSNLSDDVVDFVLEHENGVRSSFHLDFITPNEIREFWIAGSENNIGVALPERRTSLGEAVSGHKGSYDDDYVAEMEAFITKIEGGYTAFGANGWQGLEVLKILESVRTKAAFP